MSYFTFADAAEAINYLDDDNEESSESEEVSDVSVATSSDKAKEDSDSDDNEDDGEEAAFLHGARDIQNRMFRSVGTATMEDRRFRGTQSTANEPGRLGDQSRRMGQIRSWITKDANERLWSN
jgi:hypothetical protein